MPCSNQSPYSFKYVNGHPGNTTKGQLSVVALGLLNEVSNGYPLMMSEMTLLTALRTAIMGVLAAKYLTRCDARKSAIIGTGAQAEFQVMCFANFSPLCEICLFSYRKFILLLGWREGIMKILITGGTGFIGKKLCLFLLNNKHELTVLSRKPDKVASLCGNSVQALSHLTQLTASDSFDAIINLAGEGIVDARWTTTRKQQLLDSRINTTNQLVAYIERADTKPEVLISGSAIGYYGNQNSKILTEESQPNVEFAHELCAKWEAAAQQAENFAVRVCIIRTGLVIGNDGGFLKRMLMPFKLGLGGPIGDGQQWMSWIHRSDFITIIDQLLKSKTLLGIFIVTAPEPVTNSEFSKTLGKVLNRPVFLPVPALVLKILLGEMSGLLIGGQRVIPERLEKAGFEYKFKTLEQALKDVL